MADRRGARSISRRKTPTPQPHSLVNTALVGRASRSRALRSASRDLEPKIEMLKPTRRSARRASVTMTDESDQEGKATHRTKRRRPAKEVVPDLTIVEEMDTRVDLQEAPDTPTHEQPENQILFPSPGAASEMSGTTAISSFSMVEAEFLEPKYILKHMRKLCDSAREFLEHLAPDAGSLEGDFHNILEIQKPDSDFTDEYRDFNDELNVHLKHYKSDEHSYIHVRSIRRALFGANQDVAATTSGLDLVLYLANLLIFAKQMIHSDRNEKTIWDALRQLDNSFPSQFMHSLVSNANLTLAGESALLEDTLDLALELRTQLAILVLERSALDKSSDPDEVITEVFLRSDSSQESEGSIIRGWNMSALGGEDSALPQQFEALVVDRIKKIREFFPLDEESLKRGDVVDLGQLGNSFPWEPTILRLLHWVRLRHRELGAIIDELGGATVIARNVKQQAQDLQPFVEQSRSKSIPQESPRRKQRKSFGRDRRRSRKFDPNAPLDLRAIDALKSRERSLQVNIVQEEEEDVFVQPSVEGEEDELPVIEQQQREYTPVVDLEEEDPIQQLEMEREGQIEEEGEEGEGEKEQEESKLAGVPTNPVDLLKALKEVSKPEKENRDTSIFDRQNNAKRIEFGDGFDTQPTPGPSTQNKGKERAQSVPSRKRQRTVELDEESDDDAFETEDRRAYVQKRRQQAHFTKKVRIDPTSSAAPPTSHQPRPRHDHDSTFVPESNQEESISDPEGPDMTEEPPPSSKYQAQRALAKEARQLQKNNQRKPRTAWSVEEEDVFAQYMEVYPAQFSTILSEDAKAGNILELRTQVNLKDKARNMAANMIKSGTGLMPGFENIITHTSKMGQALSRAGFEW
ncbi:hypothetical protein GQ44DRAFT_602297 [Phaeosphaeriaceae sp. PMI808]|nr:hypothetical protein GQ44DRAFT_602297 [Phaeosphaeriaceae sp. PMI808]